MKLEKKNVKADAKPNMKFTVIDEGSIRDKIYEVRGVKVMLDFELAEIYGYTTKAFNQQVKNNIEKFDDDFRFQLTHEERCMKSFIIFFVRFLNVMTLMIEKSKKLDLRRAYQ